MGACPQRLRFPVTIGIGTVLVIIAGCVVGSDDVIVDEMIPAWAETLSLPDSVATDGVIEARITGTAGPHSAYRLARIDEEKIGETWVLRPITRHLERKGEACLQVVVTFDDTVRLAPLGREWTRVVVVSQSPPLLDSTCVFVASESLLAR